MRLPAPSSSPLISKAIDRSSWHRVDQTPAITNVVMSLNEAMQCSANYSIPHALVRANAEAVVMDICHNTQYTRTILKNVKQCLL